MLIKEKEKRSDEVNELKKVLDNNLTQKQRFLANREIQNILSGERGEDDSAYFIDYYYKNSKNWVVIHDLRLEYNGFSAQIDHLLISRNFDIYVLESKNFYYGIKITEMGEFLAWDGGKYQAIESPIEQNDRHIHLLKQLLASNEILPKRLGMNINPKFVNCVLVSPKARVIRPPQKKFDTSWVLSPERLKKMVDKRIDNLSTVEAISAFPKICKSETIKQVGEKLKTFHTPHRINLKAKLGIVEDKGAPQIAENRSTYYCFRCKKRISAKVARFCWDNEERFGGKAYCFGCQKLFPNK
jgi:hypothetical protein